MKNKSISREITPGERERFEEHRKRVITLVRRMKKEKIKNKQ